MDWKPTYRDFQIFVFLVYPGLSTIYHSFLNCVIYLVRPVRWGDQEGLWPLNPSALTAEPSARTTALAEPKKDHQAPENAPR